jgi:hypothetical protein
MFGALAGVAMQSENDLEPIPVVAEQAMVKPTFHQALTDL